MSDKYNAASQFVVACPMSQSFPTYTKSARSGEAGVNIISSMIHNEFGWIFRRNHTEHDFGIDGYIDVVNDAGGVTGQSIAVQVKSGKSFFATETPSSYTYYGETKHLNYYLNSQVPVILIIYNQEQGHCFWAPFAAEKTERTGSGWKIAIPKKNILSINTKAEFIKLVGPAVDHANALDTHWAFNEMLNNFDYVYYAIDRLDIENLDTSQIAAFFKRIQVNESLCRKLQGRIEISVAGYDNDHRELWEIPQVKKWFKIVDPVVKHWFFFCDATQNSHGLRTYFLCQCNTKRIGKQTRQYGKVPVEFSRELMWELFEKNFIRLNEMTDSLGMTIDENKRISFAAMDLFSIPHGV